MFIAVREGQERGHGELGLDLGAGLGGNELDRLRQGAQGPMVARNKQLCGNEIGTSHVC